MSAYACKVCLATNSRMYNLLNSYLQGTYETLMDHKLNSSATFVCFVCRSMLVKSHRLREMSAVSNMLLMNVYFHPQQTDGAISALRKQHNLKHNLNITCIIAEVNIDPYDVLNGDIVDNQLFDDDMKQEYEVKVEDIVYDEQVLSVKTELNEFSGTENLQNIPEVSDFETNHHDNTHDPIRQTETDSEDDKPLETIVKSKRDELDNANLQSKAIKVRDELDNANLQSKEIKVKNKVMGKARKNKLKNKSGKDDINTGFKSGYAREILLTKTQQQKEMADRAASLNYQNSPFRCELCYKGFLDQVAFEKHKNKHSESAGHFECEICKMRYATKRQYKDHKLNSHERQYECVKCLHRSHTAHQARDHEKWHRGVLYICELCGMNFSKRTSYLSHIRNQHPSQFVCELCGNSFVSRHGLLMHRSKSHSNAKELPTYPPVPKVTDSSSYCKDCCIQFASSEAWERHVLMSVKHANDKSTTCPICRESCEPASYVLHMNTHRNAYRRHNAPRQNNARISCHTCGEEFISSFNLQAHTRRKHLGITYNKNIVCEICGKKCSSQAFLLYHQRTHTGEKPYPCLLCDKRFADKHQLRLHTRTHTGEKPYCCNECGKRFAQKASLNRHHRIHTGLKPYECQYCSKAFSQSNSMKIHIKAVHLKQPPRAKAKVHVKMENDTLQAL